MFASAPSGASRDILDINVLRTVTCPLLNSLVRGSVVIVVAGFAVPVVWQCTSATRLLTQGSSRNPSRHSPAHTCRGFLSVIWVVACFTAHTATGASSHRLGLLGTTAIVVIARRWTVTRSSTSVDAADVFAMLETSNAMCASCSCSLPLLFSPFWGGVARNWQL